MTRTELQRCAKEIRDALEASVIGSIRIGTILIKVQKELDGRFIAWVEDELQLFSVRTAQRFMAIARDRRITDATHVSHLPTQWGTLYQLTRLSDAEFEKRLKDGTISPDMERGDISAVIKKERRRQRERELGVRQLALPNKRYGVIYADPAWTFAVFNEDTGSDRSATNHYPCMTTDDIIKLGPDIPAAKDAVLFLWTTAAMERQAHEVIEAWRFVYRTQCIWVKDKIGTGYWFRNQHEHLLVAVRGDIPAPAAGDQFPSVINAPVGRHSAKPPIFRQMIEQMFPTLPKIELFARERFDGWAAWGQELAEAAE